MMCIFPVVYCILKLFTQTNNELISMQWLFHWSSLSEIRYSAVTDDLLAHQMVNTAVSHDYSSRARQSLAFWIDFWQLLNSLTMIHQPILPFNLNTWHKQIFVIQITSSLLWKNDDQDTRCTEHFTVEEWAYPSSLALSVTDWHTCTLRHFSDKLKSRNNACCAGVAFRFYFLRFSLI